MVIHFCVNNVTIDVANELERLKRDLLCQASITTMAEKVITSGNGVHDSKVDNLVSNRLPTPEDLRHSI